jgi:hypothetical protein
MLYVFCCMNSSGAGCVDVDDDDDVLWVNE